MKLTPRENLLIWRRRQGLTQLQAARRLRMPHKLFHRIETGKRPAREKIEVRVGKLQPNEICLVERRRRQLKQKELARALGITPSWLMKMEQGHVDCTPALRHLGLV